MSADLGGGSRALRTYWLNQKGDMLHLRGCPMEPPVPGRFPEYDGLAPKDAVARAAAESLPLRPHRCLLAALASSDLGGDA